MKHKIIVFLLIIFTANQLNSISKYAKFEAGVILSLFLGNIIKQINSHNKEKSYNNLASKFPKLKILEDYLDKNHKKQFMIFLYNNNIRPNNIESIEVTEELPFPKCDPISRFKLTISANNEILFIQPSCHFSSKKMKFKLEKIDLMDREHFITQ